MPYPNYGQKHDLDAFITPQDFVRFGRTRKIVPEKDLNCHVILCYQRSLLKKVLETEETETVQMSAQKVHLLKSTGNRVAICGNFGIGAPVSAIVMEHLIELGVRKFASIGAAGSLQKAVNIGDVVLCNAAIRDEGVSHHYLEAGKYAYPTSALSGKLKTAFQQLSIPFVEGSTWTIDALYRETVAEARHYQEEGVITVEMEASALCAVAQCRGVELATAFAISDSLADLEWHPQFDTPLVNEGLYKLYQAACLALLSE
jgi:uridine phosphorylase